MLFSSPIFLFWFLPSVLFFYYIIRKEYRNWVLLIFSLLFYSWGEGERLALMLVSALLNYIFGLGIDKSENLKTRNYLLFFAVMCNLLLLIFYKYSNFFVDNYNIMAEALDTKTVSWKSVILPLGISFYTFHGMSYVIDVYRKQSAAQKNPFNLLLYISFFPQLIAGPIVRYKDISQQLLTREIDLELFTSGIQRFIIGLSKKILIANVVGRVPSMIFNLPETEFNSYWSWLAIISATIQVYFDFSGYSDMAIGLARMFGFKFKENFNYPFIANSMKEFWKRWHISLSSWFKDYVYIPLGGSKKGAFRTYLNLSIVFLLTGFWHGASWSFILFGAFHGVLIILERLGLETFLNKLHFVFRHLYVFLITSFSIIFFSIENLHDILVFYKSLVLFKSPDAFHEINFYLTNEWYATLVIGLLLCFPTVEQVLDLLKNKTIKKRIESIGLLLLFLLCIASLSNTTYNPFIYFRF